VCVGNGGLALRFEFLIHRPSGGSASAVDASKVYRSRFAPHPVVVAAGKIAVEPGPHRCPCEVGCPPYWQERYHRNRFRSPPQISCEMAENGTLPPTSACRSGTRDRTSQHSFVSRQRIGCRGEAGATNHCRSVDRDSGPSSGRVARHNQRPAAINATPIAPFVSNRDPAVRPDEGGELRGWRGLVRRSETGIQRVRKAKASEAQAGQRSSV